MKKLRRALLWLLGKTNTGEPGRLEVGLAWNCYMDGDNYLTERIENMMIDYIDGWDFEEIAQRNKCTRERVRQCILKGIKVSKNEYY